MHAKRKNWSYLVVGVIAAAIPLSALIVEPPGATEAAEAVEQQEPGVLRQADNLGYVWVLRQAGEPSFLNFRKPGSPITVKTDVRRLGPGMALIGLSLVGRAGETYRPTVTKDGYPVQAPRLQIVDRQGNVLDEGQFEYG